MYCLKCQKETRNVKYCSRSCAASVNNQRFHKRTKKVHYCCVCSAQAKPRSKYCIDHGVNSAWRTEQAKNRTIADVVAKCKNKHKSWIMSYIRTWARNKYKELANLPCERCGYDKHVEICHVQSISKFPMTATVEEINARSNVLGLCPNCHWEFDNLPR